MTRAICCRFSQSQWKTDPLSSSKSSSAREAGVSGKEISRHYSKQSSASKRCAAICSKSGIDLTRLKPVILLYFLRAHLLHHQRIAQNPLAARAAPETEPRLKGAVTVFIFTNGRT